MSNSPEPDRCAHVREEVRQILADEDRNCLGIKIRTPIAVSDEERLALAKLRGLKGTRPDETSQGRQAE